MKLKIGLLLTSTLAACATSQPNPPRTSALCSEISPVQFHAPADAGPEDTWPDTEANAVDTPETVKRLLIHNARIKALCPPR